MTDYLTIDELCDKLKLKKSYVYELTFAKKIPHIKIGRHLRFNWEEVEKWLEESTIDPNMNLEAQNERR